MCHIRVRDKPRMLLFGLEEGGPKKTTKDFVTSETVYACEKASL